MELRVYGSIKEMKKPVYLDYAATTPVDPRVAAKMQECLTLDGCFGNPASTSHCYGFLAKQAVENARQQVAELINASPQEIIWTSGATESDNLAIQGVANFYKDKGRHIITCQTEHKAVLDTCHFLQKQGFDVTFLKPQKNGVINLDELKAAIQADTILVSIMHVNNETGVVQDIEKIGEICRQHKIFFHVDAAQGAGKLPLDMQKMPIDLLSISAHKIYGPKGIGVLYVRNKPKVRLQALIHGGGHEHGLRSGTLATHQIVGMGEACALASLSLDDEFQRILALRKSLLTKLDVLSGVTLNGDAKQCWPGTLSLSFEKIDGDALLMALEGLAVSLGSACTSAMIESSFVLRAMGVAENLAHGTIRLSIGRFTDAEQIDYAADQIIEHITKLRNMAPD